MKKEDIRYKNMNILLNDVKKASGIKKKDFDKFRLVELRCVQNEIDMLEKIQIVFTNDLLGKFFKINNNNKV